MTKTTECPTCDSDAGNGFGGMCDQCTEAHSQRTTRARQILTATGQAGSALGHALGVDR